MDKQILVNYLNLCKMNDISYIKNISKDLESGMSEQQAASKYNISLKKVNSVNNIRKISGNVKYANPLEDIYSTYKSSKQKGGGKSDQELAAEAAAAAVALQNSQQQQQQQVANPATVEQQRDYEDIKVLQNRYDTMVKSGTDVGSFVDLTRQYQLLVDKFVKKNLEIQQLAATNGLLASNEKHKTDL